jgi:putative transposase
VNQRFKPDQRTLQLMDLFRQMTNECIRIGLAEGKTSLKSLSLASYPKLKMYETPSAYKLSAISNAAGILTNFRKLSKKHHVKQPYCRRLKVSTCYGLKAFDGKLQLPGNLHIPLNAFVQRFLSQPAVEVRSATLTPESVSVSVRRRVESMECTGMFGIDRNLDNVTVADTENQIERVDLSRATAVKFRCRQTRSRFHRNAVKASKKIYSKYGRLERDRVAWLIHNVSANLILRAKLHRQAIVMEDLKGIRRLYRKGNGRGLDYRSMMNSCRLRSCNIKFSIKRTGMGYRLSTLGRTGRRRSVRCVGTECCPKRTESCTVPNAA